MNRAFSFLFTFAFLLLTLLTGCVRYDVGINFAEQHHGEIVQHITLSQKLTSLSQSEATKWLESIESRASELKGKAKQISPQEIVVTIPFSNGQELVDKFNQFFNPQPEKPSQSLKTENLDLVQLKAEMSLRQSNWLFLEQNRLHLSVDLRALGVLSNQGNIIVSPGSLVDLEFALNAPWGAQSIIGENSLTPVITPDSKQLLWKLQPGQINTLEAVFWLPSYLGLGTVAIIFVMLGGFYLRYKRLPGVTQSIPTA